jgi:hypothetical protein
LGKDNSAHSIEIDAKKSKGNIQGTSGSTNTVNNLNIDDCQRELEASKKEIASLRRELELQAALLASKEETITLLRASYNRPN